jgi:hypothetical protein
MTPKLETPEWWPECPYPKSIFPMTIDEYCDAIPDENLRTAISGYLGRIFWELASKSIWEALKENELEGI